MVMPKVPKGLSNTWESLKGMLKDEEAKVDPWLTGAAIALSKSQDKVTKAERQHFRKAFLKVFEAVAPQVMTAVLAELDAPVIETTTVPEKK